MSLLQKMGKGVPVEMEMEVRETDPPYPNRPSRWRWRCANIQPSLAALPTLAAPA